MDVQQARRTRVCLRVQEVLEEPCPEDGDCALRQSALGAPRVALHHAGLVERLLLADALVEHPEARRVPARHPRHGHVLLPERLAHRLQLRHHAVAKVPEVPRDRARRQRCVRRRRALPGHRLEPARERPHLIAVPPVSPVHLPLCFDTHI
jgi:hypothetical protein